MAGQVFLGRQIRLGEAHGVERPVIMDATVDQHAPHGNGSAYRFVYVLPLGAHDVFIEDTYYADEPELDRGALSGRIDQYARANNWEDGAIVGHEAGVLPVLTGGNFAAYQQSVRNSRCHGRWRTRRIYASADELHDVRCGRKRA